MSNKITKVITIESTAWRNAEPFNCTEKLFPPAADTETRLSILKMYLWSRNLRNPNASSCSPCEQCKTNNFKQLVKAIRNKELRVAVQQNIPPYVIFMNQGHSAQLTGYMGELWKMVEEAYDFRKKNNLESVGLVPQSLHELAADLKVNLDPRATSLSISNSFFCVLGAVTLQGSSCNLNNFNLLKPEWADVLNAPPCHVDATEAYQVIDSLCKDNTVIMESNNIMNHHLATFTNCSIIEVSSKYSTASISILVRKDLPYAKIISTYILKIYNSGLISLLKVRWGVKKQDPSPQGDRPVTLNHLRNIFFLYFLTIIISVAILFLEIITFKMERKNGRKTKARRMLRSRQRQSIPKFNE
ncbi:hypothetical protein LSTR_LSTR012514 [Laodelphax striatellus]|uniref:Ionotropic glutamate receptor C-terminal domain-containing protein n=1 Tax=Laodelphax striatellus TaxID=195883 RepID=A0A482XM44_LAOST|nr:hypothetical protein LSTR_LSTR012514 [Laodelphax striatellus]